MKTKCKKLITLIAFCCICGIMTAQTTIVTLSLTFVRVQSSNSTYPPTEYEWVIDAHVRGDEPRWVDYYIDGVCSGRSQYVYELGSEYFEVRLYIPFSRASSGQVITAETYTRGRRTATSSNSVTLPTNY